MAEAAAAATPQAVGAGASTWTRQRRAVGRFVRSQPLGIVGVIIIAVMVFAAIFAPLITTHSPTATSTDILQAPSSEHWFGTTRQGKDVYSRVVYGARVSLQVGLFTVLISVVGGTVLALLAGYYRGIVDQVISRVADILIAFPSILFALTLATALGKGLTTVVISISIIFTPIIMRIMRGAVLQQRESQYVEAARVLGANESRLIFRHILPNLIGIAIITASATLPAAILTESGLSFLGVGVDLGEPSWGGDLSGDARQFFQIAWWMAVFPGLALSLTVLAFNLLGDSLRDVLDPRLRGTKAGG
jgi:ABC-type dipeptide/oligopeptide/nickel transport system permease subunit